MWVELGLGRLPSSLVLTPDCFCRSSWPFSHSSSNSFDFSSRHTRQCIGKIVPRPYGGFILLTSRAIVLVSPRKDCPPRRFTRGPTIQPNRGHPSWSPKTTMPPRNLQDAASRLSSLSSLPLLQRVSQLPFQIRGVFFENMAVLAAPATQLEVASQAPRLCLW